MATATELPATRVLTVEEYAELSDDGTPTELVRGRIVVLTRPGYDHGKVCLEIGFLLKLEVKRRGSGQVIGNDAGVITRRDPDTLRGPDVAYYSAERMPAGREKRYPILPPDLVVEVRSPSDTWTELVGKAVEYLAAGVRVVLLLDPSDDSATVLTPEARPISLAPDDELTLPDLLPEFRVRVGAIFE